MAIAMSKAGTGKRKDHVSSNDTADFHDVPSYDDLTDMK
jgi:hypothetical protein